MKNALLRYLLAFADFISPGKVSTRKLNDKEKVEWQECSQSSKGWGHKGEWQ